MSHSPVPDAFGWWASLNHGGMLIAPSKLASAFSEGADALPEWTVNRLRRDVLRARKGNAESASALLDTLLEDIVGLDVKQWIKGAGVPKEEACKSNTGETLKPARLWRGDHGASLAVFYPEQASGGLSVSAGYRLGIGRGRRAVVRVVEWLRKTGQQVALLATYRQLRLIHAGADYEAFCEWDADLWFHEGAPGPQVQALRVLLSTEALTPKESGKESPLVGAINDSRRGQSELSAALGERVRRAVEGLIQASGPRLLPLIGDGPRRVEERDIYLAATRMIMRCVVILFAEARELLPQTHPIYAQSYGLNALRVELERHSAERLRTGYGAWPRLVGLFSLMFNGSEHEALPLLRYGGELFKPGNAQSKDAVMRSIAALEQAEIRDSDVQRILELITRCPTRVPQGKGWSTVQTPVDFSALGSEYLGILYEGLLDFELKRVGEGEAVIFLGIGSEPALPFALLDGMSNAELADLLKKLGKATKAEAEEDDGEDVAADSDDGRSEHTQDQEEGVVGLEAVTHDSCGGLRDAVQAWAERAVKAAKLVPVPS